MDEHHYGSIMQVPKLEKIVINMGVGEGARDSKFMEAHYEQALIELFQQMGYTYQISQLLGRDTSEPVDKEELFKALLFINTSLESTSDIAPNRPRSTKNNLNVSNSS